MRRLQLLFLVLTLCLGCSQRPAQRVIVLGIDGCDPQLLQQFMDEGKLENFSRLKEMGSFRTLGTSNPPQSPVAWATFTTGLDPGGHGIFDFIHRDPETMLPVPSLTKVEDGKAVLRRQGRPFWAYLEENGVPSTLLKIAANFPPDGLPGKVLTGMGTPDLEGSYGTFSYYTSAPEEPPEDLSGGRFVPIALRDGVARASLVGPPKEPLALTIRAGHDTALIEVGEQRMLLKVGEWSEWLPVEFPSAHGIVRFYLKSASPHLQLYASPMNLDPCAPAQAITSPDSFSRHLCRCCGRFYTQGMPEDTKALVHGVLDDEQFLGQNELVLEERRRLFAQGISEFEEGLFFFYLSTPDILSHLYWNTLDPQHPGYTQDRSSGYATAIESAYLEADSFLGEALKELDENTVLLVLSDHGFAPFYRSFGLNAWLKQEGYLASDASGHTRWGQTRAYGIGFNGLYLNQVGREAEGTVDAAQREALLEEVSEALLAWKDPETGGSVVRRVYRAEEIYAQDFRERAPDLVVGYERGYRASWQTVLGRSDGAVVEDNLEPWSGDHLIDPEVVPGILLCNKKIEDEAPDLTDIAPTILARFGIAKPEAMRGHDLLGGLSR